MASGPVDAIYRADVVSGSILGASIFEEHL
jgi:hypothetical protein